MEGIGKTLEEEEQKEEEGHNHKGALPRELADIVVSRLFVTHPKMLISSVIKGFQY